MPPKNFVFLGNFVFWNNAQNRGISTQNYMKPWKKKIKNIFTFNSFNFRNLWCFSLDCIYNINDFSSIIVWRNPLIFFTLDCQTQPFFSWSISEFFSRIFEEILVFPYNRLMKFVIFCMTISQSLRYFSVTNWLCSSVILYKSCYVFLWFLEKFAIFFHSLHFFCHCFPKFTICFNNR